jgi:hypothetical protein
MVIYTPQIDGAKDFFRQLHWNVVLQRTFSLPPESYVAESARPAAPWVPLMRLAWCVP